MKLKDLYGLYIAHRGIQTSKTIENTIPAFALAISKKVPIELDIHILKDNNLVVYHDDSLDRLINIPNKIEDYTYKELENIVFPNTDIHIPLFMDVLKLVNGKVPIIIEIKRSTNKKYTKYCKEIVSVLKKYPYDFVIKSFDIRIVNWFLHNTDYLTGLLIAKREKSIYDLLMRNRLLLLILNPDFLSVDYHLLDFSSIKKFRLNKPVLTWTINNQNLLDKVKPKADSYLIEKFYF